MSLSFGLVVFFTTIIYIKKISFDLIYKLIILWFIIGILQISPLRDYINSVLEIIMTRSFSSDLDISRGIQLLANEPSFAGIYLTLFLVLFDFFLMKKYLTLKKIWILRLVAGVLILATKSANSILLLLSYVFIKIISDKKGFKYILVFFLIILPIVYLVTVNNDFDSRGLNLFKLLLTNPVLLLNDHSLSSRFYLIYISYFGFFDNYLLPNGVGSYSFNWMVLAQQLELLDVYEINKSMGNYLMPMSFLGGIAHDYGIFGIILVMVLIFYPLYKNKSNEYKQYIFTSGFFIFFLWLQTCSYALPLPWFILAINYTLLKNTNRF